VIVSLKRKWSIKILSVKFLALSGIDDAAHQFLVEIDIRLA